MGGLAIRWFGNFRLQAYDLNGPWLEVNVIWADYHYDLNTQVAHWLTMPGNHMREGQSLVEMVARNRANLTRSAESCSPAAVTGWCPQKPAPGGNGINTSSIEDAAFLVTTCGPDMLNNGGWYGWSQKGSLPWLCNNLWLTYRYSMNTTLLEEQVYPLLRQATNFYLQFLVEDANGVLHTPVDVSPEYGNAADTNWDLGLLRWCLKTLVHIATDLLPAVPAPLLPTWQRTLDRLAAYPVDPDQGLMIGAGMRLEHGHRHWSNLFPIFPTYDLRWANPANRSLINASVSWWEHFHPTNGFTYAGAAIYNSLIPGRADAARDQLADFVYTDSKGGTNTLYSEGSQCNESPLMTAFALQQMLLQSFDGDLHIFPALPSAWPNATFYQMRTEGAFLVSASARGGTTNAVEIESLAGSPCVLRADLGSAAPQSDPAGVVSVLSDGRFKVTLGVNQTVTIWRAGVGRPGRQEFTPLPMAEANRSHWGYPGHGRTPAPPPPAPPVPCGSASGVPGYACFIGRCADDTGVASQNCGPDLCWPQDANHTLCGPIPKAGAAEAAAARCRGDPMCHAFALNPAWSGDGVDACTPTPAETCAKFFTVSKPTQLLAAPGWQLWLQD